MQNDAYRTAASIIRFDVKFESNFSYFMFTFNLCYLISASKRYDKQSQSGKTLYNLPGQNTVAPLVHEQSEQSQPSAGAVDTPSEFMCTNLNQFILSSPHDTVYLQWATRALPAVCWE